MVRAIVLGVLAAAAAPQEPAPITSEKFVSAKYFAQ